MTSRAILCQCLLLWWWHVTDCQNGVLLEIQWYLSLSLLHFLNFHISGTEQKFLSSSNMQQSLWWTLKSRIDYLIWFPLEQINITKGAFSTSRIYLGICDHQQMLVAPVARDRCQHPAPVRAQSSSLTPDNGPVLSGLPDIPESR